MENIMNIIKSLYERLGAYGMTEARDASMVALLAELPIWDFGHSPSNTQGAISVLIDERFYGLGGDHNGGNTWCLPYQNAVSLCQEWHEQTDIRYGKRFPVSIVEPEELYELIKPLLEV